MMVQSVLQKSTSKTEDPAHPTVQALDYDLIIVGGGIVGTALACALKNSGLRIALVEAQTQSIAVGKNQAYAVSLLSSRILQQLGVWESIRPQIEYFNQIRLSDADYPHIAHFVPSDLGTEDLGYVAEHRVLLSCLQQSLEGCSAVTTLCPAEVTHIRYQADSAEVDLTIAGVPQTLHTALVVAADGSRSRIRAAAGIRTWGWPYWQSCIVCTIKPERPHNQTAYERFWPTGPFAILPLPNQLCRIVWTAPHAEAKRLLELDEAQFMAELKHRYGDQMGALELASERFLFQVQLMQSDRYALHRLVLVGDAAHSCHPVGGQGLNMGFRDMAALAEVLKTAHQQGEDLGNLKVLHRYERWRQRENLVILGFTDFLDRCFSNVLLPALWIRRLGLLVLQNFQPVKVAALRLMTGLSGRQPDLN